MKTATDSIQRMDLRRRRAEMLVHTVMQALRPYLADDTQRTAHYALFDLFHAEGVEVVTDAQRAELGLPPRGPDGWTAEELIAMERLRLELMLRPISFTVQSDQKPFVSPTVLGNP